MLNQVLLAAGINRFLAERLVHDVADEQMTRMPAAGVNHPAWVLGHLTVSLTVVSGALGIDEPLCPADWAEKFALGSKPIEDASAYPPKSELLNAFDNATAKVIDALAQATPDQLSAPNPSEEFRKRAATVGDAAVLLLTFHAAFHLGQLSTWRRVLGLPSAL